MTDMSLMEIQTKGWRVVECAFMGFFDEFKKGDPAFRPFIQAVLEGTCTPELGDALANACGAHYCERNSSHCFGKEGTKERFCFKRCKCGRKWDLTIAVVESEERLFEKPISNILRQSRKATVTINEESMSVEAAAAKYRSATA